MTYILDDLPPTPTPKDYSRIQFDPSQLPKERIVGILACQRDPLLRKLKTRIVSAEPAKIAAPPAQKGKSTKRRAATDVLGLGNTAAKEGTVLWEVITEDTVIFPEGGGQPTDTGHLSLLDPNGGVERTWVVEGCLRRKLTAVHLVRLDEGETLESGKEVELSIDWDRRADHMAIHTAQHLLSAVLDTYNLPTLSWSMTQYPSLDCPYIELPRGLTWKEVQEVEDRCNELIRADVGVWVETSMQQDGSVGLSGDGEVDRESRGIPKDYEGGVIRHISIDGIDRNACCGTQVPSLSHCGSIHILPPSIPPNSDQPSKSPTRISFTAGPRALRYLRQSSRQLSLAAQALGCGRVDLAERVGKNEELRKEGADLQKGLRGELSKLVTQNALRDYESKRNETKNRVIWVRRDEKATHDFEFLGSIAGGIISSLPNSTASDSQTTLEAGNEKEEERPVITVATSSLPGKDQTHLILVQSNDQDGAKQTNEQIKFALDSLAGGEGEGHQKRVKGGGARGRYMSKVDGKWGKTEDAKMAEVIQSLNV